MADFEPVYVPLETFDASKYMIEEPVTKKNKEGLPYTKSRHLYQNEKGEYAGAAVSPTKASVYIQGPKQRVYFSAVNDFKKQDELVGYQITYPIESMEGMTSQEKYFKEVLDSITEIQKQRMEEFSMMKVGGQPIIPKGQLTMYKGGKEDFSWFKPLYCHALQKTKDESSPKIPDTSKPRRMYVKLVCFGINDNLKCITRLVDDEGKRLDPADLINKPVTIEPVFRIESTYYGAHGTTTWCASVQIRLWEAKVTVESNSIPSFLKDKEGEESEFVLSSAGSEDLNIFRERKNTSPKASDSDTDENIVLLKKNIATSRKRTKVNIPDEESD